MNKKLLYAFTLLAGTSFGQSFTNANEAAVGATQMMFQIDSAASTLATTTGSNVTWDYSNYGRFLNGNKTYSVLANTATEYGANTNKKIEIQNVITNFLETNASGKQIAGIEYVTGNAQLGTVKINFSTGNKVNLMNYPFVLNDEIVDDCSGTLTVAGLPTPASGSSTSKFDGIGTLKLSDGLTLNNIGRHHMDLNITATVSVFGTTSNINLTINQYDYFDLNTGDFLPEFTYVKVNFVSTGGINTSTSLNFALSTEEPAGVASLIENSLSNFSVYPNPTKNTLNLTGDFSSSDVITISTLEGKMVIETKAVKEINVSELKNGVYTVSTTVNGEKVSTRFIKE